MKKLYRFHWYMGRQGDVMGTFVAEEEAVKAAIGKLVYFGEILGKHSDVHGTLSEKDLTVLTDDQDFIAKCAKYGLAGTGYNPLDYMERD